MTTRTATTTVTNGYQLDVVRPVVQDAIPLGDEDERIKVVLRKPERLARAKDEHEVAVELESEERDVRVRWKMGRVARKTVSTNGCVVSLLGRRCGWRWSGT